MKYNELESEQKMHVNGVLAQFMDNFIRNNLTWTPEQMYVALYEEISEQHKKGYYGCSMYVDGEWTTPYYVGNAWITSEDAKEYILDKFNKKYEKNKKLARVKAPMVERLRFGFWWEKDRFYDISWGLKDKYNFEKTEIVENAKEIPWSIEHVEKQLQAEYGKNLKDVLMELSESPIEKQFFEEWLKRYYSNRNNPALIPEVCGTRKKFICYRDENEQYMLEHMPHSEMVNVRYDFAIINHKKQKLLLIELDGHPYHASKKQRINDSVKRAVATNAGWQMNVVTGTQIAQDINAVFHMMEEYFGCE